MKITKAAFAAVGILSLASCSTLQRSSVVAVEAEKVRVIESVEAFRYQFPNGLRLVVLEDHSAPTFAYQTWFDVGSRDEEPGKTGLAHLFEHMMFKGTKSVPDGEFDRIIDEAGAEGQNAYTTHDHTTYIEELPKERLELVVKLESDRMRNLVVNDESFATEREVVQNERRYRNENSPEGLMYQEIYGLSFTKQAYRWPVIGYAEDLARMSAVDARAFYEKHYVPNKAVIVVTGDVRAAEVRDLVAKYYGSYPKVDASPAERQTEPEQKSQRRKTLRLNVQVEKLLMAFPIPSMEHEDIPTLDIIQMLLSGGRSSRLQKALVESGIATVAYGYAADARDPSLFLLGASMQDKMKANLAEKVILRELERLSNEEVSQLELDRARNLLSFEFFSGLETNSEKARYLGHYESQLGRIEKGLELHQQRLAVTSQQVREVARKYFQPQRRSVIVGLKKSSSGENR
jgi:zinc protease